MTHTRKTPPPLMPSAERRRILFAPIIITRYGSAGCTWSGCIVGDPEITNRIRRQEENRARRLEREYE